ncbi:MAG TPA: hypothetical protein VK363_16445 [Pyrinomonadaceae bacterium]|nr:hypothetical protein [Pyrinomonadaceae bacterium]
MDRETSLLDRAHARVHGHKALRVFTVCTRVLLALGFLPSGLTKVLGNRFTMLGLDSPVGFFFEAMYRTGFYWRFLGLCQLAAALLLLIPRTATLGALVYFPLALNIFVITVSLHFQGTPVITGLMLLANVYLLCWDYDKLKHLFAVRRIVESDADARARLDGTRDEKRGTSVAARA